MRLTALCLLPLPVLAPGATGTATAETEGTTGDADDPAIWIDEADPARSLVLGTDKTAGLAACGLDGAVRQVLPDGELNNVHLRPFSLRSQPVTLVGATRRDDETLMFYVIRAEGMLVAAIPSPCLPVDDVDGLAVVDGPVRRLVASAQGIHRAALFRLDGEAMPACEALVEVAPGAVDGVTETGGLDATSRPVGPDFPGGLLVMMDDQNAGFTTNFELIPWPALGVGP